MALTIVRDDIVKMNVDAIVNSTNEWLQVGGRGVDASIHEAAGPRLQAALAKIGRCPLGEAVVTEAFDIPSCRYILHTAGPRYENGDRAAERILRRCYRSILSRARELGCRSVAIPSIASGAYGFPKEEAYRIATSAIRAFLFELPEDEDIMVYLVLFDRRSVAYSSRIDGEVEARIPDSYPQEKRAALAAAPRPTAAPNAARREAFAVSCFDGALTAPLGREDAEEKASYADQDRSFAEMCEWWCGRKGISKKEFYVAANINKAMFWNMKHHPEQAPRKTNVLACAIGLRLDYEQTQDLLMRAGMTLTPYFELDRTVAAFIRRGNYDIDEINETLFERDLALLGAY